MEKTISSLNEKVWYRLVKVIYRIFISLIIIIAVGGTWEYTKPHKVIDNNKSYILCDSGHKINPIEKNITLTSDENYNFFLNENPYVHSDEDRKSLKIACLASTLNKPVKTASEILSEINKIGNNFTIIPEWKLSGSLIPSILWSMLALIIMIIINGIIQRVFYYIIFGTIKPKK